MSEPLTSALRPEGPQQELLTDLYALVDTLAPASVIRDLLVNRRRALSASRTAQAPQQALIARLTDYRAQVLNGFRHISRLEEAELIQAAIDGLRPPVAPAEGEQ